ncbi:MAG: cyclophilin-like fold protein [Marinilabiliaceae bacterium]
MMRARHHLASLLFLSIVSAASAQSSTENVNILITIDNAKVLEATLVDNSSARSLADRLKESPVSYFSNPYGGFESVGDVGFSLPTNDEDIVTQVGDVILYQGRNICLYYARNEWSFTRLGRITNATPSELRSILGSARVSVTLSLPSAAAAKDVKASGSEPQGRVSLDGRLMAEVSGRGLFVEDGRLKARR